MIGGREGEQGRGSWQPSSKEEGAPDMSPRGGTAGCSGSSQRRTKGRADPAKKLWMTSRRVILDSEHIPARTWIAIIDTYISYVSRSATHPVGRRQPGKKNRIEDKRGDIYTR